MDFTVSEYHDRRSVTTVLCVGVKLLKLFSHRIIDGTAYSIWVDAVGSDGLNTKH